MNRRELIRNTLVTIGAAATARIPVEALVFASGDDASRQLARPDWKPVLLSAEQNETLVVLSETIIPATDTPGAKDALVNRFLDLVLSVSSAHSQKEFLDSLAWFDAASVTRYKSTFIKLSFEERQDLMNLVAWPHTEVRWGASESGFSGYDHFQILKAWIASAYYSSPIGLKELGWDGWPARGTFRGCEHQPDGHTEAK